MENSDEIVLDILSEQGDLLKESITPSSTMEELGFDSLDLFELSMKAEERLGINGEKLENIKGFTTVREFQVMVRELMNNIAR